MRRAPVRHRGRRDYRHGESVHRTPTRGGAELKAPAPCAVGRWPPKALTGAGVTPVVRRKLAGRT